MSIFNFNRWKVLLELVDRSSVEFAGWCLALIVFPWLAVDRVDLPVWLAGEALLVVGAMIRMPGYRRLVALFLVCVAFFVVAGEVYFRLRYFGGEGFSSGCRPASLAHPWSTCLYDEGTYTGLKPSCTFRVRATDFTVNRDGFRDDDHAVQKPAGVYRIVLLGASATMGSGLPVTDLLPERLEERLNATNLPVRVEVLNLSIGGSQLGEMLHALREVGLRYDPDMIMYCANEAVIPREGMDVKARKVHHLEVPFLRLVADKRYKAFSSCLFFGNLITEFRSDVLSRFHRLTRLDGGDPWQSKPLEDFNYGRNLTRALRELKEVGGDRRVVLYTLRPVSNLKYRDHGAAYRKRLFALAAELGMDVADTGDIDFSGYRESELIVYPGDKHPNAVAHGMYTENLFPKVLGIIREDVASRARTAPGKDRSSSGGA